MNTAITSAYRAGSALGTSFEIIVVDNGSTDDSVDLIRQAGKRYGNILQLVHCHEPGVAFARNAGVKHSDGQWLQFLDADDTLEPSKIKDQIELAGSAGWVVGGYQDIYQEKPGEINLPNTDPWKGLVFGNGIGHTAANLISRWVFDQVGGYDPELRTAEDLDLYRRLLESGAEYRVDCQVRSYYHHHSGPRLSSTDQGASLELRLRVFDRAVQYLAAHRLAYWRQEQDYFLAALLMSMRVMATYDPDGALGWYAKYRQPLERLLQRRSIDFLPTYTRLYPYLGFRNVELLRRRLARVLPTGIKNRLKG